MQNFELSADKKSTKTLARPDTENTTKVQVKSQGTGKYETDILLPKS